tara:strand:- start:490 stop:711 length:222 start_codon:yes stop_codon:yes gene_type:complete
MRCLCCRSVEVIPQTVDHKDQPKKDTRELLLLGAVYSEHHRGNEGKPENATGISIITSSGRTIFPTDSPRPKN